MGGVLALVCAAATASAQEKPAAPGQMNMADHRGALQGRVTDAQGAAVAGMVVTAVSEENGGQFVSTTDAQGGYSFGARPVGKYSISTASAGMTTFRRRSVDVAMDKTERLDIVLD
ncbi:MAG TPA: carboxypeptidase-like regulatory domain-containing protein, partial [Vicinamibacterales bacterium]